MIWEFSWRQSPSWSECNLARLNVPPIPILPSRYQVWAMPPLGCAVTQLTALPLFFFESCCYFFPEKTLLSHCEQSVPFDLFFRDGCKHKSVSKLWDSFLEWLDMSRDSIYSFKQSFTYWNNWYFCKNDIHHYASLAPWPTLQHY